jgi:zinc transport system permease protein
VNLLAFYTAAFIVAALSAPMLSQIGKHHKARGIVLEVFFLAQLALVGNLVAALAVAEHDHGLAGFLASLLLFWLGKVLIDSINPQKAQASYFMVGGYLVLVSLQHLLIGLYPSLDSHMSAGFFGNLVTATSTESYLVIAVSGLFAAFYFLRRKSINRQTIEASILQNTKASFWEAALFTLPIVTCLYTLGFIYTMSFMLLPTLLVGGVFASENRASIYTAFIASLCSVAGLYLSIVFENLSTTSLQVLILGLVVGAIRRSHSH